MTGDEMFSDAYSPKLINDVIYEVECKMVTIRKGADVGMSSNRILYLEFTFGPR